MIRLSCSPEVGRIMKGMRNPLDMWNTLETSLDTTWSYISRQDILRQFHACRPNEDEPLKAYFTKLSNYFIQLDHTNNAITDRDFRRHIFRSLPSQYAMILMVITHTRPFPTPDEAMHDLLEQETTASLSKELGDASTVAALFSQSGGYGGRGLGHGHGGHGGRSEHHGHGGSGDSQEIKCTYCKIDSHATDACRERERVQEGRNNWNDDRIGFQCGLPGHIKGDCVSYKHIQVRWTAKIATATAALTRTGDFDPFWLTACALAAAAVKWAIDSGASHHMCNDRNSLSTFKILSLPIVIQLGDDNSVTATHYGFVNIILGDQVEALHTPTFWLSHLSINQLDLGRHTTIFQDGECSITSPSSCTLAKKLVNGIYIIVPTTALLSSTTKSGRKRKTDSDLPRAIISEPTIESSESPQIAPTSPPASSVLKSRLWHRRLAHMNHTAIPSIVEGYSHDDSMCTVCIQAKHKQRFIRVPVNHTTKPFELVYSDVCCPFSTRTCGDTRCYILFINDYTRYTSIWLLPNEKAETCTSAYQSIWARVDWMRHEINRFRWDDGRGQYDNKTFRYVLVARSTTHEPCPPYGHRMKGVPKRMLCTITEMAQVMMIDSQAPVQLWREAVNTAGYLHQRSPNEGLERDDHDGYQAPYGTPYHMLHGFGYPTHDADGNNISYQASLHNLRRFGCYASRPIPKVQRRG